MDTEPTREFPDALRGIQLRTVGRQEVKAEAFSLLLSPVPVQSGVVIFRVVGNHHHASIRASTDGPKILQKLPAGQGVELARLAPKEELAVAQADRSIIAHALPSGLMKQHGVLGFRRDPQPTARTVLFKMHLNHGPEINPRVDA
jgi:hypothetical protein